MYRSWCEVDLPSLKHNLKAIRKIIGPKPRIMCLVKADAYGHGLKPLARFFFSSDCDMLGCASLQEAALIRQTGVKKDVLLLSAPLWKEIPDIVRHGFIMTVSSIDEAIHLARAALKQKKRARCHIKVNTGMNRLGADQADISDLLSYVLCQDSLNLEGYYSHYACADSSLPFTRKQWKEFNAVRTRGLCRHICNSAGLLALPASTADMVRPGLLVYGESPIRKLQKHFRPALSWKARVTFTREIKKGTPVSYGATFHAPSSMRIATIPVGYGDGLFRSLSNKGRVLINGKFCRIVGQVTMDQILVDISRAGKVENGSEVVLIGTQKGGTLHATDMADDAGTIPYEVWCHITDRVPKIYLK